MQASIDTQKGSQTRDRRHDSEDLNKHLDRQAQFTGVAHQRCIENIRNRRQRAHDRKLIHGPMAILEPAQRPPIMFFLPAPVPALEVLKEYFLFEAVGASDSDDEEIEQRAHADGFVDKGYLLDVRTCAVPYGAEHVEEAEYGREQDDADVDFLLGDFGASEEMSENVEDGDQGGEGDTDGGDDYSDGVESWAAFFAIDGDSGGGYGGGLALRARGADGRHDRQRPKMKNGQGSSDRI